MNLNHEHKLLERILARVAALENQNLVLESLVFCMAQRVFKDHDFTLQITQRENHIMRIIDGSTGTFLASLLLNGAPYTPTTPFTLSVSWTVDDTSVVLTPSDDTTSVVAAVPAGDTGTSINITATTTAPDGTTVTNTVNVPLGPEPQVFSLGITQTA